MFVYEYYYVDEYKGLINPKDVYGDNKETEEKIEKVKEAFLKKGWEGDGEIKLIWIPSFIDGVNDDFGEFVWFVKQDNDGTSFIGSEHELNYTKILTQNKTYPKDVNIQRVNVIYDDVNVFKQDVEKIKSNLLKVNEIASDKELKQLIIDGLQNQLITKFFEFIGYCYLRFLCHVLMEGNTDRLKLSKNMSVKLNLNDLVILPEDIKIDDSASQELTIQQLIGEIWKNYQFLPAKEQISELIKSVNYIDTDNLLPIIYQHIFIRNCIQHHSGECTKDVQKMTGADTLHIQNAQNTNVREVEVFKLINLNDDEVEFLINTLIKFVNSFDSHINTRMQTRDIIYTPKS